jgi:hypothetical protein
MGRRQITFVAKKIIYVELCRKPWTTHYGSKIVSDKKVQTLHSTSLLAKTDMFCVQEDIECAE